VRPDYNPFSAIAARGSDDHGGCGADAKLTFAPDRWFMVTQNVSRGFAAEIRRRVQIGSLTMTPGAINNQRFDFGVYTNVWDI